MKTCPRASARLGIAAAALIHLAFQIGCGDDGDDGPDAPADIELVQVLFDEEQKTLQATLSRPLKDGEIVYMSARRGWLGSPDCASIAQAEGAAATPETLGGQPAARSAPVADALLAPFYGPEWDAPTPEMIAAAQAGPDAIATVCVMRGSEVLVSQALDLDRVRDDSLTRVAGEKQTGSASQTPLRSTVRYAERCVAELGEIPFFTTGEGDYQTFDCLEATAIPVTVTEGDSVDNPTAAVEKCDRPEYASGACEPGPRVATRVNAQGTRWVLLCRGGGEGYSSAEYDDISLIGHNPDTGKACFFQNALHAKRSGSAIPHPADPDTSHTVWSGVHGGIGTGRACVRCHDADPFIHTPWIDQALDEMGNPLVPRMGSDLAYRMGELHAPYELVNAAGQGWSMPPMLAEESAAACTQCHRIGAGIWLDWAKRLDGTDEDFRSRTTDAFLTFAELHWMPPGTYQVSEENWPSSPFAQALAAIKACGEAPESCQTAPLGSETQAAETAAFSAMNMNDQTLASAALRALSAPMPGASRRCSECHPVGNEVLRGWQAATDEALTGCLSFVGTSAPQVNLEEGTLARGEIRHFTPIEVPEGVQVSVVLESPGDADLYTRWDAAPNVREFDCRPFTDGGSERCDSAGPGMLYVAVAGTAEQSDFTITVTTGARIVAGRHASQRMTATIEAGQTTMYGPFDVAIGGSISVSLAGSEGNADLTLRQGAEPSLAAYDCRSAASGVHEHCQADGAGRYYAAVTGVSGAEYSLQVAWTAPTAELTPEAIVDCLRSDPADPQSVFATAKLGIYAAAAHGSMFQELFRTAYPRGDTVSWREAYEGFERRVSMPRGAHPVLSPAELAVVTEWFRRGLPLLDALMPPQGGSICEETDRTGLVQHITEMEVSGWAARNRDSGLNMFGCPPTSTSPLDCLTSFPRAAEQAYGQNWDIIPGSVTRILHELPFTTSYWMRSSVDGRFIGNGASQSPGAFITDLMSNVDIPTHAAFDPGFFPDNSGFLFQGTPYGTAVCSMSLLTEGPSEIFFRESECQTASEIGLYQHLAADLGGDYYAINGQFVSDNGGHSTTFGDPAAYFSDNAEITLTRMVFNGSTYYEDGIQSVVTPNEGDSVLSPSGRLVISRLAGVGGNAAGYVLRKVEITETGSGFTVDLPEIAKVCIEGAKPALSLDERYLVTHHYIDEDDYADLGFSSPNDSGFRRYMEGGAANLILVDLITGARTRITHMRPGQYALFPHFRSDGWIYFLVRDALSRREFAVASDAVLRLENRP